MRRTTLMIGRIISLCLAFVLGFFSAFGAIAGGIYFAYSSVSIDKLNEWGEFFGFNIPLDGFVDPEAETPATSLTIQDLLAEIQQVQNDKLTLEQMIKKYGLILPEDIVTKVPAPVMSEIPFSVLMSAEGIELVMDTVTITDILAMIPSELAGTIVSDPARDALSDNTLSDIVDMNMGYVLEGIQLGYITGVTYVLDENGVYQIVWEDPDNPTLFELIAPLDLGAIVTAVSNGEGNVLEVIENSIGDVAVRSIFETFMQDISILSGLIGEATLGDIIIQDPDSGEYTIDVMALMEGKRVGHLLGYTSEEGTDPETQEPIYSWIDADGKDVKGLPAKMADIYVTDFLNGTVSFDSLLEDLVIADVLGYEKGNELPVFMHDNLDNQLILIEEITVWYTEDGVPADKMMNAFAGKTLTWISTSLSSLKLADILGYYMYDGEWYIWEVKSVNNADAIVLSPGSPIMSEIAGTSIGGMGDIESTIKDIEIGTLLGYESICDESGEHSYWSTGTDEEGNPIAATGITASMADLTITELSDGYTLQNTIDGITIADVMGYTKGEDGKWYKNGEAISGPMAALADSKVGSLGSDINEIHIGELLGYTPVYGTDEDENEVITHWLDGTGAEVSGLMSAFVGLSVNDMKDNSKVMDAVQHIKVYEVMGLEKRDGVWYNKDGTKATGIMSSIAEINIGDISTEMQNITIGQMLGLTCVDGVWYNGDGSKTSNVIAALADASVGTLNDELNSIKVGEILGFTYNEEDGYWYDGNTRASGVTGALADSDLTHLNENLSHLLVGEIAGYVKLNADHPAATDGEGWYVYDESTHTYSKAKGVLAGISDLTVNQLTTGGGSELTNSLGNVKLAEALGYTEVSDGVWVDKQGEPLTGIMAALANEPLNNMDGAIDNLKIKDVLSGQQTGLLSIIDDDTPIQDISVAIDQSIRTSPLQFFIDQGLIQFDNATMSHLDTLSETRGGTEITTLTPEMIATGHYDEWIEENGNTIPTWRTQPLANSFNYIVALMTTIPGVSN